MKSATTDPMRFTRVAWNEGVALITALAMLMVFSLLGTGYVSYMSIEQERSHFELRKMRAQHLAVGGVNAAIGEIRTAIRSGSAPAESYTFEIPIYIRDVEAPEGLSGVPQKVTVKVRDEAARVNLNHAPRELLEALGMERSQVRALKNSLPKGSVQGATERRWLARVDGLRSRGILETQEYRALDKDILTVYSAADQDDPAAFLNLNTASPKVLAAVFNMTGAEAQALAAKRPFNSWSDVVVKTGRDPSTYNVRPAATAPHTMPRELALRSTCFYIVCDAAVEPYGTRGPRAQAWAEAVVVFKNDGTHEIRHWSETDTREPRAGSAPSAPGSAAEVTGGEAGATPPVTPEPQVDSDAAEVAIEPSEA